MAQSELELKLSKIENLLISQKSVLQIEEVAELTGLSKSHIYRLTSSRNIPFSKPNNKRIYFNRAEVEKWLLRNPVKTKAEIELQAESYITLNKKGGAR